MDQTATLQQHQPYSEGRTTEITRQFERDGYYMLRQILSPDDIVALKSGIDAIFEDDRFVASENRYGDYIAVRLFETAPIFEEMLTREPLISLIDSILGPDCHLVAQNAVRNRPGQSIDMWHSDDLIIFPVAEGMERHDPRLRMPTFMVTLQIPLTDIPSVEYGPTQFVPGSHYAGRSPQQDNPQFEGKGPVSMLCNAGDVYLHNGQCWHRGAPNTSDRTRYLFQMAFGMRWVSQRFYPFMNYRLPDHVLANADERRRRVLGFHNKGAYG